MLVDGEPGLAAVVGPEVAREPERERRVDALHVLAEHAHAQRGAAAAGVVGDDQGEALVLRPGPERGLAEPGVSVHRDARRVDLRVGRQHVQRATETPRPDADRAPSIGGALLGGAGLEQSTDRFCDPADVVRAEVAIVGADRGVAAGDDFFDLPTVGVDSTGFFSGAMVGDTELGAGAHPCQHRAGGRVSGVAPRGGRGPLGPAAGLRREFPPTLMQEPMPI